MSAPPGPKASVLKKARIEVATLAYDDALAALKERAQDAVVVWEERTALEEAASEFARAERELEKARKS